MYKKKIQKKNKIQILCILVSFLCLFTISFQVIHNSNTEVEKILRDIGISIQKFFLPTIEPYDLSLIEGFNRELEKENKELKQKLELDSLEYQFIHANVVKREMDWYYELTIDKGERDGIQPDMAVISNQGLIGRINKAGYSSSVVKLLIANSNDMKVSVNIQTKEEEVYGILNGYLEQEDVLQVTNIIKNKKVEVKDKVYTNGLGGIYPAGIYIGEVVEVGLDSLGIYQIAKIKMATSYNRLRYVTIVDRR